MNLAKIRTCDNIVEQNSITSLYLPKFSLLNKIRIIVGYLGSILILTDGKNEKYIKTNNSDFHSVIVPGIK